MILLLYRPSLRSRLHMRLFPLLMLRRLLYVLPSTIWLEPQVEPEREARDEDGGPGQRHVKWSWIELEIACTEPVLVRDDCLGA